MSSSPSADDLIIKFFEEKESVIILKQLSLFFNHRSCCIVKKLGICDFFRMGSRLFNVFAFDLNLKLCFDNESTYY